MASNEAMMLWIWSLTYPYSVQKLTAVFLAGAIVGLSLRRRGAVVVQSVVKGLAVAFGVFFAASMYIWSVGDPWSSGGTIAKYHADTLFWWPLYDLIGFDMLALLFGVPFIAGSAIGSGCSFRRELGGLSDRKSTRL